MGNKRSGIEPPHQHRISFTLLYFMCNFRTYNRASRPLVFTVECNLVQLGSTAFALIAVSLVRACKSAWLSNSLKGC